MITVTLREIDLDMASRNDRDRVRAPGRIQGGNWKLPEIQSARHVYDDGECQVSIAEFMSDHGLLSDTADD